ncbi:transporter substrate-binding domain-containing protein [[Phormidium] sp. LEGE 05292]|uniref:transporter substrate-binding domain-containing protein n=1 Tax=[Phormidium] sp. LEGE 05292 TaxID=767427 RepID=UPI001D146282|nr:transporter substrate-binding domain-containing protein [Phormidium sp. LEGE 05292]
MMKLATDILADVTEKNSVKKTESKSVTSLLIRCLIFSFSLWQFALVGNAAELKEIQQRGYLIVAVKDNLRPLGFRDAAGNLQGLEIDLAKRLAQEILGNAEAIKFVPVTNRDRLRVVLEGQADLTIARVTATAARDRVVRFSIPYYMDGIALVTKEPNVRSLSDLAQQKIAILKGSSTIAKLRFILPKAQLVGVDSYEEGRSLLESNGAVAFASDVSVLTGWVQEYPQYRLLPTLLSAEPLAVVMPKGIQYDDLRRVVNEAIVRGKIQDWLPQLATSWGLPWDKVNK